MAMASESNCEPSNWLLSCLLGYAHWSVSKSLCAISGNYGASDYIGLSKINKTILWSISNLLLFICHSCMNLQAESCQKKWQVDTALTAAISVEMACNIRSHATKVPRCPLFFAPSRHHDIAEGFHGLPPQCFVGYSESVWQRTVLKASHVMGLMLFIASCFFRWRKQRMHL